MDFLNKYLFLFAWFYMLPGAFTLDKQKRVEFIWCEKRSWFLIPWRLKIPATKVNIIWEFLRREI